MQHKDAVVFPHRIVGCECVDLSFYEPAVMQGYVDVVFRDVITDARYPAQK